MKPIQLWLGLGFLLLGLGSAWSRESPIELTLSLEDLTQTALAHSSQLQAAKLGYESSESEAKSAGSGASKTNSIPAVLRSIREQ